MDILKEAV